MKNYRWVFYNSYVDLKNGKWFVHSTWSTRKAAREERDSLKRNDKLHGWPGKYRIVKEFV